MDEGVLVSAQLSALFPSPQTTSIPIQTSRRNTPLPNPPNESDPPAEHALHSSVFHSDVTGTILLRVLHAGLIVELVSLTNDIPPIRFVFPAVVLPSPAIFLWQSHEIHLLAVTITGSLYRLILPARDAGHLWHGPLSRNWCREYLIKSVPEDSLGIVQIQGIHSLAAALPNGSLLRLESNRIGDDSEDDDWTEAQFHHGSFLASLTSLIPTLHAAESNGSDIVSMTSCPQPTDVGHIWTLSRDRTLRLWTAKSGCVSAKTLSPSASTSRALTPISVTQTTSIKPTSLLDADSQRLVRVFPDPRNNLYVLVFIPTPTSSASGGIFQLFGNVNEQLVSSCKLESSPASVHCHLHDFTVVGRTLYVLWVCQGQSRVDAIEWEFSGSSKNYASVGSWKYASYPQATELTPAYLDELLLTPGSMTDKFFEAIMRPGMFSPLTLRIALEQYTDACLSLPGNTPPQLATTYATIGENIAAVVGCTVSLTHDPHTGTQQHERYWNALKRDWEGFIARCREVERSARWPLSLGVGDSGGDIIIVERERVGALVSEDLPLKLHRLMSNASVVEPQYSLLEILWTLRSKIGTRTMLTLESRLADIAHQEIAFPYSDIILDQAHQTFSRLDLDDGDDSWITGRLQSIDDLDHAIRYCLDVLGGFAADDVKIEEEEVELLLPSVRSEWTRALTASYVTMTVHARYELSLAIITLLFFVAGDLHNWDPSLLAEVFVVFRALAMMRHVTRRPTGDNGAQLTVDGVPSSPDDVVARMRNMHVSHTRTRSSPVYSLLHRLIGQSGDTYGLPNSAHRFLDSIGLLQSVSPAHASKFEIMFCERMRLLGYYEVAREMLAWLPRTPGVIYVLARLWLDVGRSDDAASLLDALAGRFGVNDGLSPEDKDALASVLPGATMFDSEFNFYLHTCELFKAASLTYHEVRASQLALSVASPETDTTDLWYRSIKGFIDLGSYDDAYSALAASPHEKLKRECVTQLVHRMCEENAVEKLVSFNFAGFNNEVEDALSFNARNADPRTRPSYSRILYTWYISRGDYRNAALVMYQRARKIANLLEDPTNFSQLAELQLEAYAVAMNALSLLEPKTAWIGIPIAVPTGQEPRKRRRLSRHIPENKYSLGKRDMEVIELSDIQYEYTLLLTRVELIKADLTITPTSEFLVSPPSMVLQLAQLGRFNAAMSTARSLDVDMTDLFANLTDQCLRLSKNPASVMQKDTSDWLLTDRVSSWPGTTTDRAWRYLRQSLERHDNAETDYKYTKTALETILGYDRFSPLPPWLINTLEEHHHEYLIRISLRYDVLEDALEHTLSLIKKADNKLAREQPKHSSATWVPYTLVDQVLVVAKSQDKPTTRCRSLQQELEVELSNRVKRMQKYSHFPR